MTFKIGDTVTIKAGGPVMNITALGKDAQGNPRATCQWFDKNNSLQTAAFPLEAIMAYTGERGSTEGPPDDGGSPWTA
jgi:uncharacterized protein YodC (DUF2158 family)